MNDIFTDKPFNYYVRISFSDYGFGAARGEGCHNGTGLQGDAKSYESINVDTTSSCDGLGDKFYDFYGTFFSCGYGCGIHYKGKGGLSEIGFG